MVGEVAQVNGVRDERRQVAVIVAEGHDRHLSTVGAAERGGIGVPGQVHWVGVVRKEEGRVARAVVEEAPPRGLAGHLGQGGLDVVQCAVGWRAVIDKVHRRLLHTVQLVELIL